LVLPLVFIVYIKIPSKKINTKITLLHWKISVGKIDKLTLCICEHSMISIKSLSSATASFTDLDKSYKRKNNREIV